MIRMILIVRNKMDRNDSAHFTSLPQFFFFCTSFIVLKALKEMLTCLQHVKLCHHGGNALNPPVIYQSHTYPIEEV